MSRRPYGAASGAHLRACNTGGDRRREVRQEDRVADVTAEAAVDTPFRKVKGCASRHLAQKGRGVGGIRRMLCNGG